QKGADLGEALGGKLERAAKACRIDQALGTGVDVADQCECAQLDAGLDQASECFLPHQSSRSTKMRRDPPEAKPTSQARSSVTPNSRMRGLPSAIVVRTSWTTAPSMHPPDTDPIIAPVSSTAS